MAPGLINGFLPPAGGNGTGDLTITDTVCNNLCVQNIDLSSSKQSQQLVTVPLGFDNFQLTCVGGVNFGFGSVFGTADFPIPLTATVLDIIFGFISDDYSTLPPNRATVESCTSALATQNAAISNLVTVNVPAALSGTLESTINSMIGGLIETQGAAGTSDL